MIWFNKSFTIEDLHSLGRGTMADHVGIKWIAIGDDYLMATMPVDHRTNQPYGLLHGGASAVLAETIGSVASAMVIDTSKFICVGLEINANHIRGVKRGIVTAKVSPIHLGSSTHVWDVRIEDEEKRLVCVSRLTVAILVKR